MSNFDTFKAWGIDTGIRAVKTFAQSLAAILAANTFNLTAASGEQALQVAGLAAAASVLHNITGLSSIGGKVSVDPAEQVAADAETLFPTEPPATEVDPADDAVDASDGAKVS